MDVNSARMKECMRKTNRWLLNQSCLPDWGGYGREIISVLLSIIVNTRVAMGKSSPSSHWGMFGPGRSNTNNILYPTPNLQLW
jgi:hypothetical protein